MATKPDATSTTPTTAPPPSGPPATVYDSNDPTMVLAKRVRRIMDARPELAGDLNLLTKIATMAPDDTRALKLAADVSAGSEAQQEVDRLAKMSASQQRSAWKLKSAQEQVVLQKFGYKLPPKPSFWSLGLKADSPLDVLKSAAKVAASPGIYTVRAAKKAGGDALAAASVPVTAVTQAANAAEGWASGRSGTDPISEALAPATRIAGNVLHGIGAIEKRIPQTPITPFMGPVGRFIEKTGKTMEQTQSQGSQYTAAQHLRTVEAIQAADQAVKDGKLTTKQRDALIARQDGTIHGTNLPVMPDLLDWYDAHTDPDMPSDLQTWRTVTGSLGDAWHAARTGKLITPTAELTALSQLSNGSVATLALAKELATGATLDSILADRGLDPHDLDYATKYAELVDATQTPGFNDAVKTLSSGHLTVGTQVATLTGTDPNSTAGRRIAGGTDIALMFTADPLLIGGKALKAYRVARYLVSTEEALPLMAEAASYAKDPEAWRATTGAQLSTLQRASLEARLSNYTRAAERISKAFNDAKAFEAAGRGSEIAGGPLAVLSKMMPSLNGNALSFLADTFSEGRWSNAHELIATMAQGKGLEMAQAGKFMRVGEVTAEGAYAFPYLTRRMEATSAAVGYAKRFIEQAATYGADGSMLEKVIAAPFKPVAMMARIPMAKYMAIDDSNTFQRLLRMGQRTGWSSAKTDGLLFDYLLAPAFRGVEPAATSLAARRSVVQATIRDMFDTLGINLDTVPQPFQKNLIALQERFGEQAYATQGRDLFRSVDGSIRPVGIQVGIDEAKNIQIPTFREIEKAANTHIYGARLYRVMNPDWLEMLTAKWKQNVLVRGAFGVRIGGEEAAAFTMREGLGTYLSAKGAAAEGRRSVVDTIMQMYEDAERAGNPELAAALREKAEKLEIGWAGRVFTKPLDWAAGHIHDAATGNTRSVALRALDTAAGSLDRAVSQVAMRATDTYRAALGGLVTDPELLRTAREVIGIGALSSHLSDADLFEATQHYFVHDPKAAADMVAYVSGHHMTWHPASTSIPGLVGDLYMDVPEIGQRRMRSYFTNVPHRSDLGDRAMVSELSRVAKTADYPAIRYVLGSSITPELSQLLVDRASSTAWRAENGSGVINAIRSDLDDIATQWKAAISQAHPDVKAAFKDVDPRRLVNDIADGIPITSTAHAMLERDLAAANAASDAGAAINAEQRLSASAGTQARYLSSRWERQYGDARQMLRARSTEPMTKEMRVLAKRLDRMVAHVSQMTPREAGAVFNDLTPVETGIEGIRSRLYDAVRKAHGTERAQRWFDQSERALTVDGVPVARALPDGHMATYFPLLNPEEANAWHWITNEGGLNFNAMTEEQVALFESLPPWKQDALEAYARSTVTPAHINERQQTLASWAGLSGEAYVENGMVREGSWLEPAGTLALGDYKTAKELHGVIVELATGKRMDAGQLDRLVVGGADIKLPSGQPYRGWERGQRLPSVARMNEEGAPVGRLLGTDAVNLAIHKTFDPALLYPDYTTVVNGVVRAGASREAAVESWAHAVADQALDYLTTEKGESLHEVVHALADDEHAHIIDRVKSIPYNDMTGTVKSLHVELVPTKESTLQAVSQWGWSVIDGQVNAIAREPMMIWAYNQARAALKEHVTNVLETTPEYGEGMALAKKLGVEHEVRQVWLGAERNRMEMTVREFHKQFEELAALGRGLGGKVPSITEEQAATLLGGLKAGHAVEDMAAAATREGALARIAPYIHDVRVRTYFSEFFNSIMPFRFAEEQFLTRWAASLRHTPEAFHRMQMYAGVLHTIGWTEKDDYGNTVFHLPVMPAVYHLLTHTPVLSSLLGTDTNTPLGSDYAFSLDGLSPGLADPAHVATTPFLRIATSGLAHLFPEVKAFREADDALQGEFRSDLLDSFFPGWQKETVKAFLGSSSDAEVARASINAMQMMAAESTRLRRKASEMRANGHPDAADRLDARADELEPPDDVTTDAMKVENWMGEVRKQARAVILTRAVSQFGAPASGRIIPKVALAKDFADTLKRLGPDGKRIDYNTALGEFLAEHPDGLAYTVSGSKAVAGTHESNFSLEAASWLEEHADFSHGHREIAAWMMPPIGSGYSAEAAYAEAYDKWRKLKAPDQWLRDLKLAEASPEYMRARTARDAAIANLADGDTDGRKRIDAAWQRFEQPFRAAHPLWWEEWSSNDRKNKRADIRNKIVDAGEKGELPTDVHAQAVLDLTRSFRSYVALRGSAQYKGGTNEATENRKRLDASWKGYVANALTINPTIEPFYSAMIYIDEPGA